MARPTKLTPVRQAVICEAIEQGATYALAAAAAGVSYDALNDWTRKNDQFRQALKAAEARGVLACLRRIEEAAAQGQWQAAAWILERRYPDDYGRRDRVNVTAQQNSLNVTLIMERMRNDRSIAQQADDFLARLTGGTSAGD